jgi:hypothetical protein
MKMMFKLSITALILTSEILWSPKWPCDHNVHEVLDDCDVCVVLASLNNYDHYSIHDDHGVQNYWLIVDCLCRQRLAPTTECYSFEAMTVTYCLKIKRSRNYSNRIHP